MTRRIGIIGAGHIGATAARLFVRAGRQVVLSNSRGPESLRELVAELGPGTRPGTVDEAARFGEIVLEAIPFGRYRDLPAASLAGKIVVSAANYYPGRDGAIDLEGGTQTELVARHLADSRVLKAFNTINWAHPRDRGDTAKPLPQRRVIPIAGDDAEAKSVVAALIEEIGFAPLDMGGLREGGRRMEPGQPIYNADLTLQEAERVVQGGSRRRS